MPSFSRNLEETLHRAVALATARKHEYATLEHLLLSLIDDEDASSVLTACDVDLVTLKTALINYIDVELKSLVVVDDENAKPTAGFQRVIQRAVIHVQSSGREEARESDTVTMGIVVDEVSEVININAENIEAPPDLGGSPMSCGRRS